MSNLPSKVVPEPGTDVFRFFDLDVCLTSNSPWFGAMFRRAHERFVVESTDAPSFLRVDVLAGSDTPWGRPCVVLDGQAHPVKDGPLGEALLYDTILHAIISRVQSHVLIHAGVVVRNGQATILSGGSMHGKTTTVLTLLQRGFDFLSDEMAAIGRADGRVYPFPRALRLYRDTLARVGCELAASDAHVWFGKLLLDIEAVRPSCLAGPARIGHVVILTAPDDELEVTSHGTAGRLEVFVDRIDDQMVAAVQEMRGVSEVETAVYPGSCGVRLVTANRAATLTDVRNVCRERGVRLFGDTRRPLQRADFSQPVRLERISPVQAAMELVRRFMGGDNSLLLRQAHRGRSTRLFIELAGLIEQARCWRLFVGPVDEMANRVSELSDGAGDAAG